MKKKRPTGPREPLSEPLRNMLLGELAADDKELCEAAAVYEQRKAELELHTRRAQILREAIEKLQQLEAAAP